MAYFVFLKWFVFVYNQGACEQKCQTILLFSFALELCEISQDLKLRLYIYIDIYRNIYIDIVLYCCIVILSPHLSCCFNFVASSCELLFRNDKLPFCELAKKQISWPFQYVSCCMIKFLKIYTYSTKWENCIELKQTTITLNLPVRLGSFMYPYRCMCLLYICVSDIYVLKYYKAFLCGRIWGPYWGIGIGLFSIVNTYSVLIAVFVYNFTQTRKIE